METRKVIVATFSKVHEAYFARMLLEAEGIESYVQDEYIVGVQPLYSNAVGGVKLSVFESDVEEARRILEEFQAEQGEHLYETKHICPKCHSKNISRNIPYSFLIILLCILTIGILWLLFYKKRKCKDCGHSW